MKNQNCVSYVFGNVEPKWSVVGGGVGVQGLVLDLGVLEIGRRCSYLDLTMEGFQSPVYYIFPLNKYDCK